MRCSLALGGAALALLVACDPISEEECRIGDWAGLGLQDGQAGRPMSRLSDYGEICGALGIAPERDVYLEARAEGLKTFCTPQNAYSVGLDGRGIGQVCPPSAMSNLVALNRRGQRVHDAEESIENARDAIDEAESRIFALSGQDTDAARAEIQRLRARVRDKERDIFKARRVIRRNELY